jgi:outer membrane protein
MSLKGMIKTRARFSLLKRLMLATTLVVAMSAGARGQQPTSTPATSQTASPSASPSPGAPASSPPDTEKLIKPLTLDDAIRLALVQASTFEQARINERLAAEDVRQARAAFLPRLAAAPGVVYTSPAIGTSTPPQTPRAPSFIGANAITEYQGLVNATGELDASGRLRATLRRNQALLEAARAGTEVARRALMLATNDAYFGLALAISNRRAAAQNVTDAEEFERITNLLLQGGEVAPVDAIRARLQTTARRDELEQARANEAAAADSLRVLVGYDFTTPIATTDLLLETPQAGEVERFTDAAIASRPEFAQFAAERRAAEQDVRIARSERRPQITYSINGGFVTDSLSPPNIREHTGTSAAVGVSIPLFDWGASRSREQQARLRAQAAESARTVAARGFAQQFFTARAQALAALARIRLATIGIADAESNVAASRARYRAGEAGIIEVTDAQNTLNARRTALYQAIFDYQSARARLLQATGQ